jgi:hypothetical protein
MGYFIVVSGGGDPNGIILGATAVYAAQNCGFTDEEIVYYCLIQGKRFGPAARSILNCSNEYPWSCSPSTYMPRASVSITTSKSTILNDGSDSATLAWNITGHYNTINLSNVGSVQCSSSTTVRPTTTTTYTLTVCNNGGCTSRSTTVYVIEPVPVINSFIISPSAIVQGQSSRLDWNVTGSVNSVNISSVGPVSASGSTNVSPSDDVTYVLTATGPGGSVTRNVTLTVYVPPVITLTLDNNPINRGQSTTLRWSTTGDASTLDISPGIGSTNLTSFATVSPTQTTPYTAYASGLGGTDSEEITLTVYQPPSLSLTGPLRIYYGNDFNVSYNTTDTTNIIAVVRYDFLDGSYDEDTIYPGVNSDNLLLDNIPWGVFGPYSIRIVMTAYGDGNLTDTKVITIPVEIDETPDVIDIPQSEDKVRDEEPVVTPDAEITTEQILIDDIDIPVEIKAEYPIQVEIDNNGNWLNIREL